MMARPISITIFALYLIIVFGISLLGSAYGTLLTSPPYERSEWLLLMVPKILALCAGIALWRMLRIGAWLWGASVAAGWALVLILNTGYFPSFTVSFVVSLAIVAVSAWILNRSWSRLKPIGSDDSVHGASA